MAEDTVLVCPECDLASPVSTGAADLRSPVENPSPYRCPRCGATFDEPDVRERRDPGTIRGDSLAARLDAMEADDV